MTEEELAKAYAHIRTELSSVLEGIQNRHGVSQHQAFAMMGVCLLQLGEPLGKLCHSHCIGRERGNGKAK